MLDMDCREAVFVDVRLNLRLSPYDVEVLAGHGY